MKKIIVNRLLNGEINTIIGTLDLSNFTYTEEWYFNGIITRKEIQYNKNSNDAQYDFDLACKVLGKETNIIHL